MIDWVGRVVCIQEESELKNEVVGTEGKKALHKECNKALMHIQGTHPQQGTHAQTLTQRATKQSTKSATRGYDSAVRWVAADGRSGGVDSRIPR